MFSKWSIFSSQNITTRPAITRDDTESFLKEQMILIAAAKGVDSQDPPLKYVDLGAVEHNKCAIANRVKWAFLQCPKELGDESMTITEMAHRIVERAFKEGKSHRSITGLLTVVYHYYNLIPEAGIKQEFLHHLAINLHEKTKDWVSQNGGWVETYVQEAQMQGILSFIGLTRESVKLASTAFEWSMIGAAIVALGLLAQSVASSFDTPSPM